MMYLLAVSEKSVDSFIQIEWSTHLCGIFGSWDTARSIRNDFITDAYPELYNEKKDFAESQRIYIHNDVFANMRAYVDVIALPEMVTSSSTPKAYAIVGVRERPVREALSVIPKAFSHIWRASEHITQVYNTQVKHESGEAILNFQQNNEIVSKCLSKSTGLENNFHVYAVQYFDIPKGE